MYLSQRGGVVVVLRQVVKSIGSCACECEDTATPPWRLSIFEEIELLDDGLPEKSLTVLPSLNSTSKTPNNSFKMAAVC